MSTPRFPIALAVSLALAACSNRSTEAEATGPDLLAPSIGTVGDGFAGDIDAQTDTGLLSANWSGFSDVGSGIASYEIAVGTSVGGTDVLDWTPIGPVESTLVDNISLQYGTTYFVSVRAYDNAGNVSSPATSDGVLINDSVTETVTRHDITWIFDNVYATGHFANDDPWVVGPVFVVGINPPSKDPDHKHGAMVNPAPQQFNNPMQGYDPRLPQVTYSSAMNAALDVSRATPLLLQPGSSLVSTISRAVPTAFDNRSLQTAAVLTVLDRAPLPGSFRPPYSGTDKTVRFNQAELDYTLLRNVPKVANTAELSSIIDSFDRVWLDHQGGWLGRSMHPTENMPGYGAEIASAVGIASLHLQLDYTQAEKEPLAIRVVQLGIDLFGIIENGGERNWEPDGGHASGRKWPILLAGLLLNDPDMRDIGFRAGVVFGEDAQTFYVEETSPGVYNGGHGNYSQGDVGLAEWGIRHAIHPEFDDRRWEAEYRKCCTASSWLGYVLAARMMGVQAVWNHNALFDYQDRFVQREALNWPSGHWPITMWNAYRPLY